MRFLIDVEAKQEMREAALFYEAAREGLGQEFLNAIDKAFVEIQRRPKLWRRFRGRFRRFILHRFPYAVVYALGRDYIYVAAVMHMKRDPNYWVHRAARADSLDQTEGES